MSVEFISVASFVVMSIVTFCEINIYLVMLSIQSRPVNLAVTIPVQPRTDDQRAFMVPERVGNRMNVEFISAGVASFVMMSVVMFCIINVSLGVLLSSQDPCMWLSRCLCSAPERMIRDLL